MDASYADTVNDLSKKITLLIDVQNKRQKEINYIIKRIKNLNAIVNISSSDVPKELIKNWMRETLEELLKMEDINPDTIG